MAQDYFAILGLTPGRHDAGEITRRFCAQREQLLRELHDPTRHGETRQRLDDLHLAFTVLRDPARQAEYLRRLPAHDSRVAALRELIAAALEDGLLRHSRRLVILARARELGLNDFQAQLLIAQVQFGEQEIPAARSAAAAHKDTPRGHVAARVAAVGLIAAALFLAMIRWAHL